MESRYQPQNTRLEANWPYRLQGFDNLLRMGHCAPTVMQTILDITSTEKEWLVKLSAGMPGGIGNTGHECGAVTSPLVLMGLKYGLRQEGGGLPVIFDKGQRYCQDFLACHKTLQCREIRGNDRFPRHCIPPVLRSAELYWAALDGNHSQPIPSGEREAYTRLYNYMEQNGFHCAMAVLGQLGYTREHDGELFDAVSAFTGGTLFMGGTCSALAAGVMAIGLREGEIEHSLPRVVRLLAIMTVGRDAFDDKLNKFNRSMNLGNKLACWFAGEYGSTQCRKITGCDFATDAGVRNFIEKDQLTSCREIAAGVARQVQDMLAVNG